jgi:hypothetical protein
MLHNTEKSCSENTYHRARLKVLRVLCALGQRISRSAVGAHYTTLKTTYSSDVQKIKMVKVFYSQPRAIRFRLAGLEPPDAIGAQLKHKKRGRNETI